MIQHATPCPYNHYNDHCFSSIIVVLRIVEKIPKLEFRLLQIIARVQPEKTLRLQYLSRYMTGVG